MKIAEDIASELCSEMNDMHKLCGDSYLIPEYVAQLVSVRLITVRDTLKAIHDMYVVSGLHEGEMLDTTLALFEEADGTT